jgi:hypothetical protein
MLVSSHFVYICQASGNPYPDMKKYILPLLIVLLAIVASCSEQDRCYDSTDTYLIAKFIDSDSTTIDSLLIWGVAKNDTGWVRDTLPSLSKRYPLPLSLENDSTGFVLFVNGGADTLFIYHSMQMKLVSEACGFAPYYELKGFSYTSRIDSVNISDPNVGPTSIEKPNNEQNITVYFNLPGNTQ